MSDAMYGDDFTMGFVVTRDHFHDPERVGLMRLVWTYTGIPQATIGRVWNRIREERNLQALARMRQGDSSAGMGLLEFPGDDMKAGPHARSTWYYKTSRIR